jgi:hypothetical protein
MVTMAASILLRRHGTIVVAGTAARLSQPDKKTTLMAANNASVFIGQP